MSSLVVARGTKGNCIIKAAMRPRLYWIHIELLYINNHHDLADKVPEIKQETKLRFHVSVLCGSLYVKSLLWQLMPSPTASITRNIFNMINEWETKLRFHGSVLCLPSQGLLCQLMSTVCAQISRYKAIGACRLQATLTTTNITHVCLQPNCLRLTCITFMAIHPIVAETCHCKPKCQLHGSECG